MPMHTWLDLSGMSHACFKLMAFERCTNQPILD